jgi:hypothetical protein
MINSNGQKCPLAGHDPATHVFSCFVLFWPEDVDARVKPGQGD